MRAFLGKRWQLLLIALLSLALAGVIAFFGIAGRISDTPSTDGRTRILFTPVERDFVLNEMRHLLMAVQAIVAAANAGDMMQVAEEARKHGMAEVLAIPIEVRGPLIARLPIEFKRLGFGVHEGLDTIALDAESLGDRNHTLKQMAGLMDKCIACHASYTVMPAIPGEPKP
ncbi:MAG: hypothetical protein HY777_03865 [Betaproteobacteria bacterium]|nr:hypothetical protein [Betaproteobacteria bacterium]